MVGGVDSQMQGWGPLRNLAMKPGKQAVGVEESVDCVLGHNPH
eukprot:CAMPEP_0202382336 /NCGR_PEP_ID=MMETSP1127-20130417/42483_1 /ASSEMBLY_ACC=CAM_ASM_000462 /TAXON_ID=3047 /ORGANISM="Dunaliella tertiolecta, Strain CCMP1320" /LENGTH=42 /DNA_ID= /DNA_START= /DNA_END= /DNA_ORIENTATION=